MKILVSDKTSDLGLDILRKAGFIVDIKTGLNEDDIIKIIADYDAQIVRSETKVTAKIMEYAKKLKVIARAGVGVDNIDLVAATKKGIIVVNSPEGNTIAAAEHSFALLLSLARNIPMAYCSMKEGKWERSKYMGVEVYNKTLGVVGLGKIGSHVAKAALGMGMKVIGFDPFVSKDYADKIGVEIKDLEAVFSLSDFISLHVPKSKDTSNMINKDTFKKMKDGVRLINCARGGIINELDLLEAVESGKVAGAAVDVFDKEPIEPNSPLLKSDKIVFTPHLGASTKEAQVNVAIDVAEQIVEVLNGGQAKSAVNIPSLKPDLIAPVAQFMSLAEKLGSLIRQLSSGAISELNIEYLGALAHFNVSPLTTAILKGFLENMTDGSVNFVNAQLIAKERNIKIIESKTENALEFANLICIKAKTDKGYRSIAGTFSKEMGDLITDIDGYIVNAKPQGFLLVLPNQDVPGVVGRIGAILGQNQVNIAGMHVGRSSIGGKAIMVLNIDNNIDDAILKDIEKIDGIIGEAKLINI